MAGRNNFDPFVGQPIRSAQTYLRRISHTYSDIPKVIPDGKYGEQTEASVEGFQKKFKMEPTGVLDKQTWDKILLVYSDIIQFEGEPEPVYAYPSGTYVILPGGEDDNLYVIQSMMFVLSKHFSNIEPPLISGIYDEQSVITVKQFQKVFGMQENGIIEKTFWDKLAKLYEANVVSG